MMLSNNKSNPALSSRSSVVSTSSSSDGGSGGISGSSTASGGPTTPEDLKELLSDRYYGTQVPCRHYDEILNGLFLGDMKTARNVLTLEKLGITHVLNAAYTPSPFTDRETSEAYYRERNFPCEFLGIPACDFPSYKISQWFEETSQFIHEALRAKGRVFVHCQVGVSRSATLVIAYLMMKHKMPAIDAVQFVGCRRPIFPNDGFLKQICELDYKLSHPKSALLRSFSTMSRRTFSKLFRSSSTKSSPGKTASNKGNNGSSTAVVAGNNNSSFFGSKMSGRRGSLPCR